MANKNERSSGILFCLLTTFVFDIAVVVFHWLYSNRSVDFQSCISMFFVALVPAFLLSLICTFLRKIILKTCYKKLTKKAQEELGITKWLYLNKDAIVEVNSSRAVRNYDPVSFFRGNREKLIEACERLQHKRKYADALNKFLSENTLKKKLMYRKLESDIKSNLGKLGTYDVLIRYVSPAGRSTCYRTVGFPEELIEEMLSDPSVYMEKKEYNQLIKEQNKKELEQKRREYYSRIDKTISFLNDAPENIVAKSDICELNYQVPNLIRNSVEYVRNAKSVDDPQWEFAEKYILEIENIVDKIQARNDRLLRYYASFDFLKIKELFNGLLNSEKEFNEYIAEKARSISKLFGLRQVRCETMIEDEYNYIRPYRKSVTPFVAEVSASVFASAENSPIEYIVKHFYPDRALYPDQIQKLQMLIEDIETLKDARQIIENQKQEYQKYLSNVPDFIWEYDKDGFYSRLGFADISESTLTVEYKFVYTSDGGKAQRSFVVPMTESTIIELIDELQSKLTMSCFTKEQRRLMTSKLRQFIKERDDYTCKLCGNSTYKEPNLLLEIDHIVPVSKGGYTEESNLQTLCWKCNRSKSNTI